MERTWITNEIEYISPTNMQSGVVCCGIIFHSSPTIFIDTCIEDAEICKLLGEVQPEIVLCTHFHVDHSATLKFVPQHTRAKIFLPRGESQYLNHLRKYADLLGPYDEQLKEENLQFLLDFGYDESTSYLEYDDSKDLGLAHPDRVQVIPTPGHSPNHKAFYFPEEKLLLSGDMGLDNLGPWYAFPNCNIIDYAESILRLMALDIQTVITSHSRMITEDVNGRFRKCLQLMLSREKMIRHKLEKGYSHDRIIEEGVIFKDKHLMPEPLKTLYYNGDRTALIHHLKVIEDGGLRKHIPQLSHILHD